MALDFHWWNGVGNWNDTTKWIPISGPPTAGDTATIYGTVINESIVNVTNNVTGLKSPLQLTMQEHGRLNIGDHYFTIDGPIDINTISGIIHLQSSDATDARLIAEQLTLATGGHLLIEQGLASIGSVQIADGRFTVANGLGRLKSTTFAVGDGVGSSDARLRVLDSGRAEILSPTTFYQDADVTVGSHATLALQQETTFAGGGHFTGFGLLQFDGATTTFLGDTTIDMPDGALDLDGPPSIRANGQTLRIAGHTVLNAKTINDTNNVFGSHHVLSDDVLQIDDSGKLTVHLTDPAAGWTMNGYLMVHGAPDQLIAQNLAGSDIDITGSALVQGNSDWDARVDLHGTINLDANSHLRWSRNDAQHPHTLAGGNINGPGTLAIAADNALVGFGTLNAALDFSPDAELRADGGVLTLTPSNVLQAMGTIGTNSETGVLLVQHAWNTKVAHDALDLRGGQVWGEDLTNGGTTRGHGVIATTRFDNLGQIQPVGGLLTIASVAAPDLDGNAIPETGRIDATNGDLRVTKAPADVFNGVMIVGPGHRITLDEGWVLSGEFGLGELNLNGGIGPGQTAEMAGGPQYIFGTVNVTANAAFLASTAFGDLARVHLPNANDRLELGELTEISEGATFDGAGQLYNRPANTLTLLRSANVGVQLVNAGIMLVDDSETDARVGNFTATTHSTLVLDLRGTIDVMNDQLIVADRALLDGQLEVRVNDGGGSYAPPALRGTSDAFTLIHAAHRQGEFKQLRLANVDLPLTYNDADTFSYHDHDGLFHLLQYDDTDVRLINYRAMVGDSNGDGAFNSDDLVTVFTHGEYEDALPGNSDWTDGDWNGDGDFSSDDLIEAFQLGTYEEPSILPAVAARPLAMPVPEPGCLVPLVLMTGIVFRREGRPSDPSCAR